MPDEPLKLTLDQIKALHEAASNELDAICQGGTGRWTMHIPALETDSDLVLGDALHALKMLIEDERVQAALGRPAVARDDTAELVEALERFKAWADRWEGAVYAGGIEAVMGTGPARKELLIAMNRASAALAAYRERNK